MAVSDALEFDLPVGDGPAGPEGDETIYCDFSMLPEELGQRAGRALASMAAALRGDDSEFPWGEPDPVGVGIALQVLSFLPERTKAGRVRCTGSHSRKSRRMRRTQGKGRLRRIGPTPPPFRG